MAMPTSQQKMSFTFQGWRIHLLVKKEWGVYPRTSAIPTGMKVEVRGVEPLPKEEALVHPFYTPRIYYMGEEKEV